VYAQNCASCHGAKLEGQPDWKRRLPAPPHDDSGHTWHHADNVLVAIVKNGLVPPYATPGYESDTPAFGGKLSDEEIWAVLAYVKSHWSREVLSIRAEMFGTLPENSAVSFYDRLILPRLIDLVMKQEMLRERRAALVPRAKGRVLEIGIGSGLNLPYYSSAVGRLYGVDPSPQLLAMARGNLEKTGLHAELVCDSAERLPFPGATFDSAVMTWDAMQHPAPAGGLARNPPRAEAGRRAAVRRARPLARAAHRGVAAPAHAVLAAARRRLPPRSADRSAHRLGRARAHRSAEHLSEGAEAVHLHL